MEGTADDHGGDGVSVTSRNSTPLGWNKLRMSESDREKVRVTLQQLYLARAKLKAVSRTSALIAGFAMVAMVEVQLSATVDYGSVLLFMFSTVTTCLVSVHLFALMISTCLLPTIEAVSSMHTLKAIESSPHMKMRSYIEVAWILSTGIGLILFLIEIVLLIWLKFIALRLDNACPDGGNANNSSSYDKCAQIVDNNNGQLAAWVGTALLIPVVLVFAGFAFHFYRTLAHHRYNNWKMAYEDFDEILARGDDMIGLQGVQIHSETEMMYQHHHNNLSRVHSAASERYMHSGNASDKYVPPGTTSNNPSGLTITINDERKSNSNYVSDKDS